MTAAVSGRVLRAVAAVVLAVALLGGQAVADARIPALERRSPASPVGRAGFAYLTGLRRFAAVLLYDRLEPQFHGYYGDKAIKDLTYLLPNYRVITWLDPQFVQAHYVSTWILLRNGRDADAFALIRQAVADNPRSGLLHVAYAQMLFLRKRDVAEQVRQADLALADDAVWADGTEQWQSMMIIRDICAKAGEPAKAQRALDIAAQLEVDLGGAPGFRDPDEQF